MLTERVFSVPSPCNERGGARPANETALEKPIQKNWELDVFPNPSSGQISITSKNPDQLLNINIRDLSGRSLFKEEVKLNGNIANLELPLINGAYLITVTNQSNERTVKKLLIAK